MNKRELMKKIAIISATSALILTQVNFTAFASTYSGEQLQQELQNQVEESVEITPAEEQEYNRSELPTVFSEDIVGADNKQVETPVRVEEGTNVLSLSLPNSDVKKEEGFILKLKGTTGSASVILPEGITYRMEDNQKNDGTNNENLIYDEQTRKLTILNLSGTDDSEVKLFAEQTGAFNFEFMNEDESVKSNVLTVNVLESIAALNTPVPTGLSGLALSPSLNKNVLDLDIDNDSAEVRFAIQNNDATSKLNNGKLVIDLSGAHLTVVDGSFPTTGSGIKSATYSNATKQLVVTLNDNFSGSTEFPFSVQLNGSAKSGDSYAISATLSGTNLSGVAYDDALTTTDGLNVVGTDKNYTEATAVEYDKWSNKEWSANAYEGFAGQFVNMYSTRPKGDMLHFTDLRIEKVYNDESFYWGNNSRPNYNKSDFIALYETKQVGTFIEYQENQKLVYSYGDVNLSNLKIFDNGTIPATASPGNYQTTYNIYNGDEIIYTMVRKITVKQSESLFSYRGTVQGTNISKNDYFNLSITTSGSSTTPGISNLTQVLVIPEGIKPIEYRSPRGMRSIEYELNNSGVFLRASNGYFTNLNIGENNTITRIRITYNKFTTWAGGTQNADSLVLQNSSIPDGQRVYLETESITYNDYAGVAHDYIAENPTGSFRYPVTGDDSINTTAGYLAIGEWSFVSNSAVIPNNLSIYNGNSYNQGIHFGTLSGSLKNPYIFVIVPKGVTVTNSSIPGFFTTLANPNMGTSPNKDWLDNSSFRSEILSDGRTIYYYQMNGTIKGTGGSSYAGVDGRFLTKFTSALTGQYELEYGVGALDTDDYNLATVTTNNGYTDSTLTSEIKNILGSNVSRYVSHKQTITVGELNSISTTQAVKGSEDSTMIDGAIGTATSVPGTTVDYEYSLSNNGTTTLSNFEFIDMLPYSGDTMITTGAARGSLYSILATDSVKVYINGVETGIKTYYSKSTDALRFDGQGNDYGAVNDWTLTKPSDMTTVKAIKVALDEDFKPGDKITFSYTGQLPTDAPRNGEIAYNSLAYRGYVNGKATAKELGLTGVVATAPQNDGEVSGMIFADMNKDGNKNAGELGVNGVTLELFKTSNLTTPIATVSTSPSGSDAGQFVFNNLEYDSYKIRVKLPDNSDFITSGTNKIIVDANNSEYGWLQVNSSDTFTLSDIGGGSTNIANISGGIFRYTPISGTIAFKDKNGVTLSGDYGKSFKVELLDSANSTLASTISTNGGSYTFGDLELAVSGTYLLKFTNPSGKSFVFENGTGELTVNLTVGLGVTTGITDLFITDNDLPTGSINLTGGDYNPTKATIIAQDATTQVTTTWKIVDSLGTTVYSGTGTEIANQLAYLKSDEKNGTYEIVATLVDSAKNTVEVTKTFTILATKPILTTTSDNETFEIDIDTAWTDADIVSKYGITAVDALGNPIPASAITLSDTVDYTTPGSYTVTVTATDLAGNTATKNITVVVALRKIHVSYMVEGTEQANVPAIYNTLLTQPTNPSKTGYTFDGWYDAATGGTKWNFEADKAKDTDFTLYARFSKASYTVTFDDQGTTTTASILYDELVAAPAAPSKPGYTFDGWYNGPVKWNFGTDKMPASNLTLTAKFNAENQTIAFDAAGGDAVPNLTAPTDSSVDIDAQTTSRAGYSFIGWFDGATQISGTIPMPAGGLNLNAHWTADDQVIQFNTNGGTGVASITAATDTTFDLDAQVTTQAGYTFLGWYDGADNQVSGIQTVPAGGATYTAKWQAEDQTITFDINGGDVASQPADLIAPTDTDVNLNNVTAPNRFGFEFIGWYDENGNRISDEIPMPAGGLTLKAEWKDLIATGSWKIEANNFTITVSELNVLKENDTLQEEILKRSQAKAWVTETETLLNPIQVDADELLSAVGTYQVKLYYTAEEISNQTRILTAEQTAKLETTIAVTVKDDEPIINPSKPILPVTKETDETTGKTNKSPISSKVILPITGETTNQSLWLGLAMLLAAGYYFLKKFRLHRR